MIRTPTPSSAFQRDTRPIRITARSFRTSLHGRWNMARGPNAGYLAALLLDALLRAPEIGEQQVRAYHARFVAVPVLGAVDIPTRLDGASKAACVVSGELRQGARICVLGSVTTSSVRASIAFRPQSCPVPGRALDVPPLPLQDTPPVAANYEYRALHAKPSAACSCDHVGGFLRFGEPQRFDARVLTAFCDAWYPAAYARHARPVVGTSIDLTVHFRDHAALASLAPDAFVYCRFRSREAHEGFVDEDGELWTEDGQLLAQSRQLRLAAPAPDALR